METISSQDYYMWWRSIAQSAVAFALLGILNLCLQTVLSAWWIQTMWGMLCFWLFFDALLIQNDLKVLQASHDDMVVRYTYLSELYNKEQSLNQNEINKHTELLKSIRDSLASRTSTISEASSRWESSPNSGASTCVLKIPSLVEEKDESIIKSRHHMISKSQSYEKMPKGDLSDELFHISIRSRGRMGLCGNSLP